MKLIIDIGTTNITTCRWHNDVLDEYKFFRNLQTEFGADILTRLKQDKNKMQQIIFSLLNKIIDDYEKKFNEECKTIVVAGNTVMCSLFLGSPFNEIKNFYDNNLKIINGKDINFKDIEIILPPIMDRFVGSDAFSVLVDSGVYNSKENIMILDLGTNAELIFGNQNSIYFTSFAGGPAFEGDTISCGSSEIEGAIKNVLVDNGQIKIKDVNKNFKPKAICATGLLDIIDALKNLGKLSKDGRLEQEKINICDDIYINQLDIREIQKSKSACVSSIKAIINKAKFKPDKFILTGTFGYYLDIEKAISIGLLPNMGIDRYFVDQLMVNKGAKKISQMQKEDLDKIFSKLKFFPLEQDRYFIDNFVNNFSFEKFYV